MRQTARCYDYDYTGMELEERHRLTVGELAEPVDVSSPQVTRTADLMKLAEIGKYLFCEAVWPADDQDNAEFFTEAFSFYGPLVTPRLRRWVCPTAVRTTATR